MEIPIEQTVPPRLLTRADCAWRGAGIFAGTGAAMGVANWHTLLLEAFSNGSSSQPVGFWAWWQLALLLIRFGPLLALLGALLGWYHCEAVLPEEERERQLRAPGVWLLWLPRMFLHLFFYGLLIFVCACLTVPLEVASATLEILGRAAPPSRGRPRLTAPCWTFAAFLGWPRAGTLYDEGHTLWLAEFRRSLGLFSPLPLLLALFMVVWARQVPMESVFPWPWPLLTFWLGDYLLLWHVLHLHGAGRLAVGKWSPRFSLRTLLLAVLAWGAWLTLLTWVWRE